MNTGLTTQEQIALAKEILQVKNRRERSLKLGEILDREKLSSDDMYALYNTLLTAIRVYGDVIGFDDKDFQEMALTILVLEKVEEAKETRVAQRGAIPLLVIAHGAKKRERSRRFEMKTATVKMFKERPNGDLSEFIIELTIPSRRRYGAVIREYIEYYNAKHFAKIYFYEVLELETSKK